MQRPCSVMVMRLILSGFLVLMMAGPWLFEIQVEQGNQTFSAYFAATVGEQ